MLVRAEPFLAKLDVEAPTQFSHWQVLCGIHTDLGFRLIVKGKKKEIEVACRKVIAILDSLESEFGGQDEHRTALAERYVSACWLLHHQTSQHLDARERLARRALAHLHAVAAQSGDDAALRSKLAKSYQLLAHVLIEAARAKEAEAEFRQALALYQKLAKESPEVTGHRFPSAEVHNSLALLLRGKDPALAEKHHSQALALFEALSDELPADAWCQHNRAATLATVGVLRRDRGDLSGAKALLEQAVVYAQKACDLDPSRQAFRDLLRSSQTQLETTLKAQESEKKDMPK